MFNLLHIRASYGRAEFYLSVRNQAFKLELLLDIKGTNQKTGDLYLELNGMDVNMSKFPPRVPNGIANGK